MFLTPESERMNKMFENIPFPSLFVCFLIFIAWMHYEKRKAGKKEAHMTEEFWQREEEANRTRNKDISNLPFLQIREDQIPMPESSDENTCYYQKKVLESINLPMMDLSPYTNTDLKLAYGVGNFKTLSDYDENFNSFLMNLSNLGKAYSQTELFPEAATVFRLCLDSGSKSARDYKALANVYSAMGERHKISGLIKEVEASDLPRSSTLVESLRQLL